jgi:hypothetical protein
MRLRLFLVSAAIGATLIPAAIAGPTVYPPSVKWPDLIVSNLQVVQSWTPVIKEVTFTVKEACGVAIAKPFHVALTIAPKQGAAPTYSSTLSANALPANGSQTWTIPLVAKQLPLTSFVRVDADPNNEVLEDVETNNYQQLNPNMAPFPQNAATYCKPHKIGIIQPKP